MQADRSGDAAGEQARKPGPLTWVAVALTIGVFLGRGAPFAWLWWSALAAAMLAALWHARRGGERGVRTWGLLGVAFLGACWYVLATGHVPANDLQRFVPERARLVKVQGTVAGGTYLTTPERGAFGMFTHRGPGTLFEIDVDRIWREGALRPAYGRVLVKIEQADYRIQSGQRVEATGWLSAIRGPVNPGEFDFAAALARRGVVGRLAMPARENVVQLEAAGVSVATLRRGREWLAEQAGWSLTLGMDEHPEDAALAKALLLGQRERSLQDMHEAFQQVGLAHVLSISGAHLGILLGLTWLAARIFWPSPPRAAAAVLIILGLYLMVVPLRVPIIRAAVTSGLFAAGYASGRRASGVELLALAAALLLLVRPADLFTPGFQLSFVAVAAILIFGRRAGHWLWPEPAVAPPERNAGMLAARFAVRYLGVSLVAFFAVLPLVAWHFKQISPWAAVLSVLALPVLTGVLGLGFVKIIAGWLLPSASILLAGPLAWLTGSLRGLVDHAQGWPGVWIDLPVQPSGAWALAVGAVVVAAMSGLFARRRMALTCAAAALVVWCGVEQEQQAILTRLGWAPPPPAARLHAFHVGNGSCYLLQVWPDPGSDAGLSASTGEPFNIMFDCGSSAYLDVGEASIAPALKAIGVEQIDLLMLSHADFDHFCGALDVAAEVPVTRVLMPPQMLAEAEANPRKAVGYLLEQLEKLSLRPDTITRGWRMQVNSADLSLLWPLPGFDPKRNNDTSLVLRAEVAGRVLMLSGDIGHEAKPALMDRARDLQADVCDLPHHGSFVEGASGAWLARVEPRIVLHSSARRDFAADPWAPLLAQGEIRRLATAERGMVTVEVTRAGILRWRSFAERGSDDAIAGPWHALE